LGDLFTPRQLTAMVTLSDLVREARADVRRDAAAAGLSDAEADAYTATVTTFLGLAASKCLDFHNSLSRWSHSSYQPVRGLFGRQAIPMIWDFAEASPLSANTVGWSGICEKVAESLATFSVLGFRGGHARQVDAASGWDGLGQALISTDPPYYDNIGYAALSDFFYVWLRRTLGDLHPDLFGTILVPKEPELVAAPERFGGDKRKAKEHFEQGFRKAFARLREKMDPRFPLTVYYAFKQDDEEVAAGAENGDGDGGRVDRTTGWETLLTALVETGFQVTATWPVRSAQKWRQNAMGANALASYIVIACRPRPEDAPRTDRRAFVAELKRELPAALRRLQQGNIAPVDFAQAAIGPGMAIFSKLQSGARGERPRHERAHGAGPHQPDPDRGTLGAGGRVRRRHPLGRRLVRAARVRGGRVRRRRRPRPREEHERFRPRRGRHRVQPRPDACGCCGRTSSRPTGIRPETAALPCGRRHTTSFASTGSKSAARRQRRNSSLPSAPTPTSPASSRTGSSPSLSGRNGRARPRGTMPSSSPGPGSNGSRTSCARAGPHRQSSASDWEEVRDGDPEPP
jgi:hypothetical protein